MNFDKKVAEKVKDDTRGQGKAGKPGTVLSTNTFSMNKSSVLREARKELNNPNSVINCASIKAELLRGKIIKETGILLLLATYQTKLQVTRIPIKILLRQSKFPKWI